MNNCLVLFGNGCFYWYVLCVIFIAFILLRKLNLYLHVTCAVMPRTRRHTTSTHSSNQTEPPGRSIDPSTPAPTPSTNAREHQEAPPRTEHVETTEVQVVRGHKISTRTWDVQIRGN